MVGERRVRAALLVVTLVALLLARSAVAGEGRSEHMELSAARRAPASTLPPLRSEPQAFEAPLPQQTTTTTTPPAATRPGVVLVVGDSIADFTAQSMEEIAPPGATVIDDAIWGCGVAQGGPFRYFGAVHDQPPNCDDWPQRWKAAIDQQDPAVVMLMVGRWEMMDRAIPGGWSHIGNPKFDQYLSDRLEAAVTILSARGAHVVVTTAPYFRRGLRPDGGLYPEDQPGRVDRFNELLRAVAARHPGHVWVIDFGAKVTPGGFTTDVDGMRVRRDGVHLTQEGSRWAAAWLLPQLLAP